MIERLILVIFLAAQCYVKSMDTRIFICKYPYPAVFTISTSSEKERIACNFLFIYAQSISDCVQVGSEIYSITLPRSRWEKLRAEYETCGRLCQVKFYFKFCIFCFVTSLRGNFLVFIVLGLSNISIFIQILIRQHKTFIYTYVYKIPVCQISDIHIMMYMYVCTNQVLQITYHIIILLIFETFSNK